MLFVFPLFGWAADETPGEVRFFAQCPHRLRRHLHHEANPLDPHAMLYTATGIAEVEFLQVIDWLVGAPFTGTAVHPCRDAVDTIRVGYHQIPPWRLTQRMGEFFDALQLPELSIGDATAMHTLTNGGVSGPGSGMVMRVNRLVDWIQHVVGDLNGVCGRFARRPDGLVTWALPERAIDGAQWLFLKAFTHVSVFLARTADSTLSAAESAGDQVINLGYQTPHQQQTVFLRLPASVYRAHELWFLEHQAHVVVGTATLFQHATHATLAHHRQRTSLAQGDPLERVTDQESPVIAMTTVSLVARAPASLKAYVVPARWVLNDEPSASSSTTP